MGFMFDCRNLRNYPKIREHQEKLALAEQDEDHGCYCCCCYCCATPVEDDSDDEENQLFDVRYVLKVIVYNNIKKKLED